MEEEINYNPTRPCKTCDDDYIWFAGEWLHCGTESDERCPALYPELKYISKAERKKEDNNG